MTRRILPFLLACIAIGGHGGSPAPAADSYRHLPNFAAPRSFFSDQDFHPVGYLSSYPVRNPGEHLNARNRARLRHLFMQAHRACKLKYGQDSPISSEAPIYRLLAANFPAITQIQPIAGGAVFLGAVSRALAPTCSAHPD